MKFFGLEKLSLVDYDDHTAATVFTGGCNLLCPYCHNSGLVKVDGAAIYSEEDILSYLKKRQGLLDGLAITGGEPTLHKNLPDFIKKVKELGYEVKLDSNGTNPEMLDYLFSTGLVDYAAMDIKNCLDKYCFTVGKEIDLSPIKESVELIMKKAKDYEFRTTIVAQFHTEEDIEKIGAWIKGAKKYALQKFTDSGNCLEEGFSPIPEEQANRFLEIIKKYIPNSKLRGY